MRGSESMSWSCDLVSDKKIFKSQVQSIVDHLPKKWLREGLVNTLQDWGWHLFCDIHLPEGCKLGIGGSPLIVSIDEAKPFVEHFKHKLERDYEHRIDVQWEK